MLKCFGALPTEERAKAMREEDYLWCAVNLLLDEEEVARQLCPQCREAAERARRLCRVYLALGLAAGLFCLILL